MGSRVIFRVNGKEVAADLDQEVTLLDYLRNSLRLMGTKNGCGTGHCGACTVILNGKARRACQVQLSTMNGKKVETIEGLARTDGLHPIQSAFIQTGAIQCGFCTPGMIMTGKALLDQNLDPSLRDIQEAFKYNICRCTGYVKIIDAVRSAAQQMRGQASPVSHRAIGQSARVGESVPDYDAVQKVKGDPIFAGDL